MKYFLSVLVISLATSSCLMMSKPENNSAVAEIFLLSNKSKIGEVSFTRLSDGNVEMDINLKGLQGVHAINIHEYGDIRSKGVLGGHFNPFNVKHGKPEDGYYSHAGDLGNITANNDGHVRAKIVNTQISLRSRNSIIGRSIIIHAGKDDFSDPDGNSGPAIAGGIIGYSK